MPEAYFGPHEYIVLSVHLSGGSTLLCAGLFFNELQVHIFFGRCKQDPRQNPSTKLLSQVVCAACSRSTGGL